MVMKTKEAIKKELLKAVEHTEMIESSKLNYFEIHMEYASFSKRPTEYENKAFAFKKTAIQHINNAVDILFNQKEEFKDLVSKEFVEEKFGNIIEDVLFNNEINNKNNVIIMEVDKFLKEIQREAVEFVIFFNVKNLRCSNVYDFGKVKLYPNQTTAKEDIEKNLDQDSVNIFSESPENVFQGADSIAGVHIKTFEGFKAVELAYTNLEQLLGIFRGFSGSKIWIGGESPAIYLVTAGFNKNTGDFFWLRQASDSVASWECDLDLLHKNKTFEVVEKLLREQERTKLENKIIDSLVWLGESVRESDNIHKLLKLIISLEVLLIEEEYNKKSLLGERCAFLLEKEYKKRLEIINFVEEMYRIRNKTVHEGKRPYIQQERIRYLSEIIMKVVSRLLLLSDEFESFKEVKEYVEWLKFSE